MSTQVINEKELPAFFVSTVRCGINNDYFNVTIGGGYIARFANLFVGYFKNTIKDHIEEKVENEIKILLPIKIN